ncbi:hypothetical protein GA0115254_111971 [Streptomyces sp. Ncost-T10-10d]|nr:hypothetical protein GA0115254_111971 [Streptomyces sp. Ncost-T10-10d]
MARLVALVPVPVVAVARHAVPGVPGPVPDAVVRRRGVAAGPHSGTDDMR